MVVVAAAAAESAAAARTVTVAAVVATRLGVTASAAAADAVALPCPAQRSSWPGRSVPEMKFALALGLLTGIKKTEICQKLFAHHLHSLKMGSHMETGLFLT